MIVHSNKHQKLFNIYLYFSIRVFFLFSFLFGFIQENYSQTYPFRHYTVEDGLISSETYHIYQDTKGYIWIATDDGVSKFDGTNFINYTKENGLPDNTVFEFFEDYKNRVWFVPYSLNLSYFQNDTIVKYEFNDSIQSRLYGHGNPIKLNFFVDSTNTIFFRDKKTKSYSIDSLGNIKPYTLSECGKCFDVKNNRIIRVNSICSNPKPKNEYIYNIFSNNKNIASLCLSSFISEHEMINTRYHGVVNKENIYIARGKYIIHIKGSSLQSIKAIDDKIIWINLDNNNNLWVGTYEGAYCFHKSDLETIPEIFLNDKSISSVLNDSEGGYWFTTLFDGIYYLPNIDIKTYTEKHGLLRNEVKSLAYDSSSLWMGFNTNYAQNFKSGQFKNKVKLDELNITNYNLFYDDFNKKLWIGGQTLSVYSNSNMYYFNNENSSRISKVFHTKDFLRDKNNNIWIASIGLFKYHDYNTKNLFSAGNFKQKINSICLNLNNNILMGCNTGLWEYKIDSNKAYSLSAEHELFNSKITNIIFNDYHNNNWLGSRTNGIIIYDEDTVFNITSDNGLSNNNITSLFTKNEVIWATTQNGLSKITLLNKSNKDSIKIESFSTIHGLPSNELNDIYIKDTIAYVASKKGLSVFNIKKLHENSSIPKIYITNISIMEKDTIVKDNYVLPHYKNSVTIEFTGLIFRNAQNKKYKYQFTKQGQEPAWIETNENQLRLSFLPPGNYAFKVIAINENGIKSSIPATLNIIIKPPYWKTWWFITLLVITTIVFIAGILFIIYYVKVSEIKRRNNLERKLLLEVNKFRQQALSQQMNPHFIFNTLNSIQYYIYENDNVSSTRYLAKFSKLMRLILDNSQHDTIPIQKELEAMQLYLELESVRLDNQLDYEINTNDIDVKLYKIHPLLIQPYVENSIWHGLVYKKGEKNVKIEIKDNTDSILCIIEDNGIGRKKAMEIKEKKNKEQVSHGTNITGKRIDSINKLFNQDFKVEYIDLNDDKGNACGTKVLLQIPKIY